MSRQSTGRSLEALSFVILGLWPGLLFAQEAGSWHLTNSMAEDRYGHTATLLQDGRVLVVGGEDVFGVAVPLTEVFDPRDGSWSPADSSFVPGRHCTATALSDGRVLVLGGVANTSGEAAFYDPRLDEWTLGASMSVPRYRHTATLLASGEVLIVGGESLAGSKLASGELFDPDGNSWRGAGGLTTAVSHHTATAETPPTRARSPRYPRRSRTGAGPWADRQT